MRRLLLLLLVVVSLGVSAQDFYFDGIYYQVLDSEAKTCSTKEGNPLITINPLEGDIELAAHPIYNGEVYTLTTIGKWSLNNNGNPEYINSIIIPNTVTTIGEFAFALQSKLQSIEIPESVENIDRRAFTNCLSLTSVRLNNGLKRLGEGAFVYCRSLMDLELPSTLETLDGYITGAENETTWHPIESLIVNRFDPPTITDGECYPYTTKLYVPVGAKENYLKAEGWKNFSEDAIIELDKPMLFLDKTSATMVRGSKMDLVLTYAYDTSKPSSAPGNLKWVSSDESVVTIAQAPYRGIVTAVGEGKARVTLTIKPNNLSLDPVSAYCDITVKEGNISFNLSEKNLELSVNETGQIVMDIKAIQPGKATLSVSMTNDKNETITETCNITVLDIETDVTTIFDSTTDKVDVYNLNGICVLKGVEPAAVKTLSPGLYIVGDKKILVK